MVWTVQSAMALSPGAFTQPATRVTGTSAILNGAITPNLEPTTAWFEWGEDTNYANITLTASMGNGASPVQLSTIINGLNPHRVYHFRVVAQNNLGATTHGADQLFTVYKKLWGWGDNSQGSLNFPSDLTNVVSAVAGAYHVIALRTDGTVVDWGSYFDSNVYAPTYVPSGLSNVIAVAAGGAQSLALKSDGTVVAWGLNTQGQTNVPAGLTNVIAICGGFVHSLALRADHTVAAWGATDYNYGQGTVPSGLSNVVTISTHGYHNLAIKSDGTVFAWGLNNTLQTNVPTGLSDVKAIAAGGNHSMALKNDGTLVCWGWDFYGETDTPNSLTNPLVIAAGSRTSMAIQNEHTVLSWGDNSYGQNNVTPGLSNIVAITSGRFFDLAFEAYDTSFTLPFLIASAQFTTAGFHLSFYGDSNQTYSAWFSTNLFDWVWLGTPIQSSPGHFDFGDTTLSNSPLRFYRLSQP